MRLFLISYQKSGTHQIMPAIKIPDDVVDRSYVDMAAMGARYGMTGINYAGIPDTCAELRNFEASAFGHLPYLPEYAEALQFVPTKALFNIRDPRDIVVSNFYNIQKVVSSNGGAGHLNLYDRIENKFVIEKDDPIKELIIFAATRWYYWLGWLDYDWVLPVKYEDLRQDGGATIRKIQAWLPEIPLDIPSISKRLAPQPSNPTFRKGNIGDWKTEFSDYHKELAANLLGDVITRLGYEI